MNGPAPQSLHREFPDTHSFQWLLRVERGKGSKAGWVPCDEISLSLQAYRTTFGLPSVPLPGEALPLLLSVRQSHYGNSEASAAALQSGNWS